MKAWADRPSAGPWSRCASAGPLCTVIQRGCARVSWPAVRRSQVPKLSSADHDPRRLVQMSGSVVVRASAGQPLAVPGDRSCRQLITADARPDVREPVRSAPLSAMLARPGYRPRPRTAWRHDHAAFGQRRRCRCLATCSRLLSAAAAWRVAVSAPSPLSLLGESSPDLRWLAADQQRSVSRLAVPRVAALLW